MSPGELLTLPAAEALAEGFARSLGELAGSVGTHRLRAAARAASLASAAGHTCIDLGELAGDADLPALRAELLASGVVTTAAALEYRPLVLDEANRLYLHRYFVVERRLAARLRGFAARPLAAEAQRLVARRLDERFGSDDAAHPNRQKLAAARALEERLTVISGGPGTGKTTTVVQILALGLELDPGCRIVLAAPTGKAAARLREAVQAGGAKLPEALRARLPETSFTLHRLLAQAAADGGHLACDLLVVDEASMLDLILADRLLAALGPQTRLIVLGDRDQLAAVEAGAVFSAISAADSPLGSQVVELRQSFRFGPETTLGRLAAAARDGLADEALRLLADAGLEAGQELTAAAIDSLHAAYAPYLEALQTGGEDPRPLFAALGRFRVLCALREGPRGVAGLNEALARRHRTQLAHPADPGALSPWFPGRPVLVTRNDPLLRLFNGDVGIALAAAEGGIKVWFEDGAGGFRAVAPARLPPHETAFAMTVHKAQGSEFDAVALVLPATISPLCTRELVYTGITRARQSVAILAPKEVLRAALSTPTVRHSGLPARLRESAPDAGTHA